MSFSKSADLAIVDATKDYDVVTGTGEPSEVARLVSALPRRLVDAWAPLVSPGGLTVTGLFLHAKPKVAPTYGGVVQGSPELADLLIIFDRLSLTGISRRALLIQAKVGTNGQFSIAKGPPQVQRKLYANWPPFTFRGDTLLALKPQNPCRFFSSSPPSAGADIGTRYACVDRNAPTPWALEAGPATFPSDNPLIASTSLGDALEAMYYGSFGLPTTSSSGWAQAIEYLDAFAKFHQKANSPWSNVVRKAGAASVFRSVEYLEAESTMLSINTPHPLGALHLQCLSAYMREPTVVRWDGRPLRQDKRAIGNCIGGRPSAFSGGFGVLRVLVSGRVD